MKKTHGLTNSSSGSKGGASSGLDEGLSSVDKVNTEGCGPAEAKKQQRPKEESITKA